MYCIHIYVAICMQQEPIEYIHTQYIFAFRLNMWGVYIALHIHCVELPSYIVAYLPSEPKELQSLSWSCVKFIQVSCSKFPVGVVGHIQLYSTLNNKTLQYTTQAIHVVIFCKIGLQFSKDVFE